MIQRIKSLVSISSKSIGNIKNHLEGFKQVRTAHRHELIYDYVELISELINEFGEARQVEMVARLGVSQPTVAKMLKRLGCAGLVDQVPYRGVFLTFKGKKLAKQSKVRHHVVETFLLALGVSPETARRDSEGIEHHVSTETLNAFQAFYEKNNY